MRLPLCLLAGLLGFLAAEEPLADLPDPYGLGQRLVQIDELRRRKIAVPQDASDAQVRELYRAATQVPPPATTAAPALSDGPIREADRRRDLLARQRRVLSERYGVLAPPEAGEAELNELLAKHARRADERRQASADLVIEREQAMERAYAQAIAATVTTRSDGSGATWVLPRFAEEYETRRSPYLACRFSRLPGGKQSPPQLMLVVFMPGPPAGVPRIALRGGDLTMPLSGFPLHAVAGEQVTRAQADVALSQPATRDALVQVVERPDARIEYRFGDQQFTVPLDDTQREGLRQVLSAYVAGAR